MQKDSNVKEYFTEVIGLAMESAEMVTDPKDRAVAYAQIANALANTGLIITGESQLITSLETAAPEFSSDAKAEVPDTEEPAEEQVEEEPVDIQKTEQPQEEETEEAQEEGELDPEVEEAKNYIHTLLEEYEYDEIEAQVAEFAPGVYSTMEDITEENIVAFAQHLKELVEG